MPSLLIPYCSVAHTLSKYYALDNILDAIGRDVELF